MKNQIEESKIPRTGRIGRFAKILDKETDRDIFLRIMEASDKYDSFAAKQKSSWWKETVKRMEEELGADEAIQIMRYCGEKCCGKGQRKTARRLMDESGLLEVFLNRISTYEVTEGDLRYTLKDKNTIIAEHNKCFCKQVAYINGQFENLTYCHCSVEFNKQFFTAALGKEVEVEIVQSIISGAESCKFIITIPD